MAHAIEDRVHFPGPTTPPEVTRSGGSFSVTVRTARLGAAARMLRSTKGKAQGWSSDLLRSVKPLVDDADAGRYISATWQLFASPTSGYGTVQTDLLREASRLDDAATEYERSEFVSSFLLRPLRLVTAPTRLAVAGALTLGAERTPGVTPAMVTHAAPGMTDDAVTVFSAGLSMTPLAAGLVPIADLYGAPSIERQTGRALQRSSVLQALPSVTPARLPTILPVPRHDAREGPPRDAGNLLREIASQSAKEGQGGGDYSRVRVRRVTDAQGRSGWIVQLPGTQTWSMNDKNPSDAKTNLEAMGPDGSLFYTAVEQVLRDAMAQAGVEPGDEPVLLAGYSQGGMVATRMAQDARFRHEYRVTHVLTAGSPVSGMKLPGSVVSMDLAHTRDLVPRLDGKDAPDEPNRLGWTGEAAPRPEDPYDPVAQHGADRYAESASAWVPRTSTDPDAQHYYRSGMFFDGVQEESFDYHLTRERGD